MGSSKSTDYAQEVMIRVDDHRTNARNERSGAIHILPMLDWLIRQGLTAATGLNQVDFGWEICSTRGKPETFTTADTPCALGAGVGSACYAS